MPGRRAEVRHQGAHVDEGVGGRSHRESDEAARHDRRVEVASHHAKRHEIGEKDQRDELGDQDSEERERLVRGAYCD